MEYSDYYDDDDDNISVHSLAVPMSDDNDRDDKDNKDNTDSSDDPNSPESIIRKKSGSVLCYKMAFVFLLIASGISLSLGAYLTNENEEGGEEENDAEDDSAVVYAIVTGCIFFVLLIVFLRYDFLVSRRQSLVLDMAKRSKHIVDSLFPSVVRDRMMKDATERRKSGVSASSNNDQNGEMDFAALTRMNTRANEKISESAPIPLSSFNQPSSVTNFLTTGGEGKKMAVTDEGQPIADLFPNTTVLFADIAGFTKWSAERDPPQVFVLLETVYSEFDKLAEQLKVFKVETIGDSYMAVTGLPEPNEEHAVAMARFAYQCQLKMATTMEDLAPKLGEGTTDLGIRVGMHSGPVTAGVLRGQKSRFQLFGDTVNTASRMESNGIKGKIQVSESTANLLITAGKMHWLKQREDAIDAKGKGKLRTFWLSPNRKNGVHSSNHDSERDISESAAFLAADVAKKIVEEKKKKSKGVISRILTKMTSTRVLTGEEPDEKLDRLTEHNTDILLKYLTAVITNRHTGTGGTRAVKDVDHSKESKELPPPFESVSDVIILPGFDHRKHQRKKADIGELAYIRPIIRDYVAEIAAMYKDVPFHNFEHASHVTLAANKLVGRMIQMDGMDEVEMYNATFGISADPLTHFSIVFGALIHDLGHLGVSNAQLVLEENDMALKYKNRSVAEQNSMNEGWRLLLEDKYEVLRTYIYKTNVERKRFRQIVNNAVMATDIADREINQIRGRKWDKAFKDTDERGTADTMTRDEINRKATVVIENLIQVADVSHTMQHWHVYRKWNARLFEELTLAFRQGRSSFDPADNWANGEIGFFDFYIIPLIKKMKESGVFGSAGDQYLGFATSNREMWKASGAEAVKVMIEDVKGIAFQELEKDDDSIMGGGSDSSSIGDRDTRAH